MKSDFMLLLENVGDAIFTFVGVVFLAILGLAAALILAVLYLTFWGGAVALAAWIVFTVYKAVVG